MPTRDHHRSLARPRPRARPRARRATAGGSSSTPAAPQTSTRAARELGHRRRSPRSPATSPTPRHRAALVEAAGERIDLLVNNASVLGPSPQPRARRLPARRARARLRASTCSRRSRSSSWRSRGCRRRRDRQRHLRRRRSRPTTGWGGYGSSKAALEQLTAILAAEQPELRVYAVDPGDMRTRMHQEAFPGEDISDRPPPEDERARPAAR